MNGHVHQYLGEPRLKPSQFKKESLGLRGFTNRNLDSPQLLEKILTKFEGTVLEEPSEPEEHAVKTKIFKWELKLKKIITTHHNWMK